MLIQAFLRAEGYVSSLQQLETETNVSLQRFEPCDNVDLLSIVAEYEEYYKFKFDKQVKLVKRTLHDESTPVGTRAKPGKALSRGSRQDHGHDIPSVLPRPTQANAKPLAPLPQRQSQKDEHNDNDIQDLSVQAHPVKDEDVRSVAGQPEERQREAILGKADRDAKDAPKDGFRPILAAPPSDFPPELLSFYYVIQHEILTEHPTQTFKEVIGLEKPK